jgi:hypothetical protein
LARRRTELKVLILKETSLVQFFSSFQPLIELLFDLWQSTIYIQMLILLIFLVKIVSYKILIFFYFFYFFFPWLYFFFFSFFFYYSYKILEFSKGTNVSLLILLIPISYLCRPLLYVMQSSNLDNRGCCHKSLGVWFWGWDPEVRLEGIGSQVGF